MKVENERKIVNLYMSNKSIKEITNMFNITHTTVYQILKKHGIERNRRQNYKLNTNVKAEIVYRCIIGGKYEDVGKQFGLSKITVFKYNTLFKSKINKNKELQEKLKQILYRLFEMK